MNRTRAHAEFPVGSAKIGPKQVAAMLGVDRVTAWRMMETGEVPSLIVRVTARGVERRSCTQWVQEKLAELNQGRPQ